MVNRKNAVAAGRKKKADKLFILKGTMSEDQGTLTVTRSVYSKLCKLTQGSKQAVRS